MPGNDKVRFCAKCEKNVYDLSMHTEAEGRAIFEARKGERTCVRFARDATGAVRFRSVALAAAVAVAACSTHSTDRTTASPACAMDTGDHDMGDAIPDVEDQCPDEPAGANDADEDGCPDTTDAGAAPSEPKTPAAEPWFPTSDPSRATTPDGSSK
jgi:hypothetical protein